MIIKNDVRKASRWPSTRTRVVLVPLELSLNSALSVQCRVQSTISNLTTLRIENCSSRSHHQHSFMNSCTVSYILALRSVVDIFTFRAFNLEESEVTVANGFRPNVKHVFVVLAADEWVHRKLRIYNSDVKSLSLKFKDCGIFRFTGQSPFTQILDKIRAKYDMILAVGIGEQAIRNNYEDMKQLAGGPRLAITQNKRYTKHNLLIVLKKWCDVFFSFLVTSSGPSTSIICPIRSSGLERMPAREYFYLNNFNKNVKIPGKVSRNWETSTHPSECCIFRNSHLPPTTAIPTTVPTPPPSVPCAVSSLQYDVYLLVDTSATVSAADFASVLIQLSSDISTKWVNSLQYVRSRLILCRWNRPLTLSCRFTRQETVQWTLDWWPFLQTRKSITRVRVWDKQNIHINLSLIITYSENPSNRIAVQVSTTLRRELPFSLTLVTWIRTEEMDKHSICTQLPSLPTSM